MKAELDHSAKAGLEWLLLMVLLAVFALAGLFIASRAVDVTPYWGGLGFTMYASSTWFRLEILAISPPSHAIAPTSLAPGIAPAAAPSAAAVETKATVIYLHGIHGKPENGCPVLRQGASDLGWLVCPRANANATELAGTFSRGGTTKQKLATFDAARGAAAGGRGDAQLAGAHGHGQQRGGGLEIGRAHV